MPVKVTRKMRRRRTPSPVLDEMQKLYPDMTRQEIINKIHENDLTFAAQVGEIKLRLAKEKSEQDELNKIAADKLLNGEPVKKGVG